MPQAYVGVPGVRTQAGCWHTFAGEGEEGEEEKSRGYFYPIATAQARNSSVS